jgi:hypothetical protein
MRSDKGKTHRVCRACHQIIGRHHKWKQVRFKRFGFLAEYYELEHRDCKDPTLAKAKLAAQPEAPIEQWLRENNHQLTTWTGSKEALTETIQ